jgi:hypothetical protein
MSFTPRTSHTRSETCKSFRRTLLRRPLHNFSAINLVTHLDGITYRQNDEKSRKSFRRLLLRLFVPVSPLGAHSYKKRGGWGIRVLSAANGTGGTPSRALELVLSTFVMYH